MVVERLHRGWQGLRAVAALPEDLSSILGTMLVFLQLPVTPAPGVSDTSFFIKRRNNFKSKKHLPGGGGTGL